MSRSLHAIGRRQNLSRPGLLSHAYIQEVRERRVKLEQGLRTEGKDLKSEGLKEDK